MKKQNIQDVAIAEILNPTLAITKQFLTANNVVLKENVPFVEDVIVREEVKIAEVYFPVDGERYYIVVYINLEPQLSVCGLNTSPGNCVYFYVISEEHSLDELIALAGVVPTRTWQKWEKGHRPRHNGFEVKPSLKETGEVEDKLRTLITLLQPYKANLQVLSTIAHIGINIAYWGYKEQMWGIHFDTETIQELAALNISVDVDLYASGPDLGGNS